MKLTECAILAPLSLKLAEEIKYETENSDQSEPEFLSEFKSEGVWKVSDSGALRGVPTLS